jgi:hypothetical protein
MVGVPAVTLIDFEKVVYHVPEDNIGNIGLSNLNRAMDLTMQVIGEEAYSKVHVVIHPMVYVSGGGLVICVLILSFIKMKEKRQ